VTDFLGLEINLAASIGQFSSSAKFEVIEGVKSKKIKTFELRFDILMTQKTNLANIFISFVKPYKQN
jgi:hypothetical protein